MHRASQAVRHSSCSYAPGIGTSDTTSAIGSVLASYRLRATSEPAPVPGGTLNWNFRVQTNVGPLFVRRHRSDLAVGRILQEHRLLAWLGERGIPVVLPAALADGSTVLERPDGTWAAYPWVDGTPPSRGAISPSVARHIGDVHGRIHAVLADHPGSHETFVAPVFDIASAAARLERALALAVDTSHDEMASVIKLQLALLRAQGSDEHRFDAVPNQLAHGDFHDQQIILSAGREVVAVVDWEMFGMRPRVFEVVRSLSFSMLLLDDAGLQAYLDGYRAHIGLSAEECRAGMDLWWQSRLHNSWTYDAFLRDGNERVVAFLPAMRTELEVLSDSAFRRDLAERFVRAAAASP